MDRKYIIKHELESLLTFISEGSGLTPRISIIEENLNGVEIVFRELIGGNAVYSKRFTLNQDVSGVFIDLREDILGLNKNPEEKGGMNTVADNIERLYCGNCRLYRNLLDTEANILHLESYIQYMFKR